MKNDWIIDAAVICDKGLIRKNNEDAFYFDGCFASLDEMDDTACLRKNREAPGSLWAVCDGMGGQSNGEMASYSAVSRMRDLEQALQKQNFDDAVQEWVDLTSRAIGNGSEGGTTLTILYGSEQDVQAAHVGDSRIYCFHEGKLQRLTRDHTKVEMMVSMGMITEEEAKNHPQRHTISRYLGMDSEYTCSATVSKKIPYCAGDRYLLCSDGVTDMLTDDQLESFMQETGDCESCAVAIRDAVFAAGAMDNTTIIVLDILPDKRK